MLSYVFFVAKITINPQEIKSALNGGIIYGSAIFLGLIVLCLLLFPDILYGFPKQQLEGSLKSKSSKVKYIKRGFVKNKEQEKEQAYYRELEQEILSFFASDSSYLNPNFKMAHLVTAMDVPQHHISYCLSHYINKSLHQLKLESRIQWAAAALLDPKFNTNTIDAIGNMAGYQSKSAFYKAFKEHHCITPQEYQQNNK